MFSQNHEQELAETSSTTLKKHVKKEKLSFSADLEKVTQLYAKGPICLNNGNKVITANSNMEGEVGSFKFDES